MIKEQSVMEICNKYSIDYSWKGDEIVFRWPETVSISMEDLWKEIDANWEVWEAQEYSRNRASAYPPMADQLDYMFHNGFDKWKENIVQPVKDKYPKPE